MDAREPLAKRNHRDGDLWNHVRADKWSPTEDCAVESAGSCFAGSGVGGFNRRDIARARVPCSQLRHALLLGMMLISAYLYLANFSNGQPMLSCAGKWIPHFIDPALMWKVLAVATTFAGNLTIIGSVANMIVVESAREHLQVGFWDYARFGIPITIPDDFCGYPPAARAALRNCRHFS